jgi:hypothetical protein
MLLYKKLFEWNISSSLLTYRDLLLID